jgi:Lon protease-like protein
LRAYLEQNRLKADWTAIERAPSEYLINALCVMSPYGPEEKQALLEAEDLKRRAEVLIALAEMELASTGGPGGTLQ